MQGEPVGEGGQERKVVTEDLSPCRPHENTGGAETGTLGFLCELSAALGDGGVYGIGAHRVLICCKGEIKTLRCWQNALGGTAYFQRHPLREDAGTISRNS